MAMIFHAQSCVVSLVAILPYFLGYTYFMNHKMEVVRTRMFSYLNPRRKDLFATSFAMQVARIERGRKILVENKIVEDAGITFK